MPHWLQSFSQKLVRKSLEDKRKASHQISVVAIICMFIPYKYLYTVKARKTAFWLGSPVHSLEPNVLD